MLNVLSAIWPREPAVMRAVSAWLPLEVTQPSRAVMLMAGLALIQITRNLGRRKAVAWWVAQVALAVSLERELRVIARERLGTLPISVWLGGARRRHRDDS